MNRWTALKSLAPTLALMAAMAPAPVSATGGPAGGFVIPAGATATFTGGEFSACNNLSWGYQLNLGPDLVQASKPYGCAALATANVTIGPFATPTTVRVFLKDMTCGATYYSDGIPVDHVIVSGANPYFMRFADGGFFCELTNTTANTFTGHNFKVTLTIEDSCKDHDLDSQLNLECEQDGQHGGAHVGDGSVGHANHADDSVQPLKATQAGQSSGAQVSAGNLGHVNHADNQNQPSKTNQDS